MMGKQKLSNIKFTSCEISYINILGRTAIILACMQGYLSVVKYLVSKGADIHEPAGRGMTPMMVAFHRGHQHIMAYLMSLEED